MNKKPLTNAQKNALQTLKNNPQAKVNNFVLASLKRRGLVNEHNQIIQQSKPQQPPMPILAHNPTPHQQSQIKRSLRKKAKKQGVKRKSLLQQHGF